MRDKVLAALENKTNLPAFPLTAQMVLAYLANPKMNIADLANSIKTDQAYTAVILRMVNSAGMGLHGAGQLCYQCLACDQLPWIARNP